MKGANAALRIDIPTGKKDKTMKRRQAWHYLAATFSLFWLLFAIILIVSDFPFYVISIALTSIAMLSVLIVALAWAYQNNL